ncbi:MAG: response regulator [Armatimonadota bacterium]
MAVSTAVPRPLKVLVVDDEDDVLEVFRLALSPHGHEVTVADNGPAAIEAAGKTSFDVAFIDIAMSPMDGLSTLSRLKAVSPETRFIMITAFYGGELSHRVRHDILSDALKLGARGCLRKPFDLDAIVRTAEYFGFRPAPKADRPSPAEAAGAPCVEGD